MRQWANDRTVLFYVYCVWNESVVFYRRPPLYSLSPLSLLGSTCLAKFSIVTFISHIKFYLRFVIAYLYTSPVHLKHNCIQNHYVFSAKWSWFFLLLHYGRFKYIKFNTLNVSILLRVKVNRVFNWIGYILHIFTTRRSALNHLIVDK